MKPETEVLFMKEQTYHIYLDSHEKTTLLHSLVELKKSTHTARQIYRLR